MREQLEEIRESALVARTLKCSLEQQITATRMQLLRLEREEIHAAHHIERCKFPLAPIRRIPNEILSTIFVCYAEITHAPSTDFRRGVWILGHICRHWRVVVLSTPAVWSSFRYLPSDIARRGRTHGIQVLWRRNDVPPQHLEDTLSNVEDASKDVFDALLTRSPQWKAAKFEIPASIHPEMRTVMDNLPNLARFHLDFQFRRDDSSFHDTEIFRSCPRLVDLTLELSPIPELFTYPLSVLANAPNIIDSPDAQPEATVRSTRVRLELGFPRRLLHRPAPPLESLEFRFQDPRSSTSCLVDVLTAVPALTRLVIWNGARDDMRANASEVFHSLIHSPGLPVPSLLPRLKYLEVSGFELHASFVRMVESRCVCGCAVSGIQVPESDVDPLESLSVTELPVDTDPALLFRLHEIEMRCRMKLAIRLQNSDAQTRPFIRISNA
ncbi:hypothetical protein DFH08DRAFT_986237 [Mycena albidolilacea]|uniref:F-box domain-containing protein n=1 Tax=Mycena albidolilacea TaxID=1033008 RepID=A0AAD7E9W1_9AGAR|nr:hypothetical protein DFH08DRAFT_986237 [Mycena albidolilacea]